MCPTEILPEYDSLDAVPEPIRDSWALGADGKARPTKGFTVETIPEVAGLKRTLDQYKQQVQGFTTKETEYTTQLTSLQQELDNLKKTGGSSADKAAVQSQIDQMKNAHKTELENERKLRSGVETEYESTLLDNAAAKIAQASGTDSPTVLEPHIRAALKIVVGQDGKRRVQIIDQADANKGPLYDPKTGNEMALDVFAATFATRKEFKGLFPGDDINGGNAPGSNNNTRVNIGGKIKVTREQMKNAETYNQIKEQAKKRGLQPTEIIEYID